MVKLEYNFEKENELSKPIFICAYDSFKTKQNIYKCTQEGCHNFFVALEKNVNSGNTKSCGCKRREHMKKVGKKNKKTNTIYFPLGCSYGVCFYDNYDSYFIFSLEDYDLINSYHWTALKRKKRIEPVTNINGHIVRLARLLNDTPFDKECDHINGNTNDARRCNLRNCTPEENKYNRKIGQGRVIEKDGFYYIVGFSKEDTSSLRFTTKESAQNVLCELQDLYFKDFAYSKSQEISKQYEINQFDRGFHCFGILDDVSKEKEKNVYKIMLTNIERNILNSVYSEEDAAAHYLRLIEVYKDYKKEKIA